MALDCYWGVPLTKVGGVIYPIVLHRLIPMVGFGWAVRTIGFIVMATLLVPNFCMKVRVLPAEKRPLVDWTAFHSWEFMLFCFGGFIGFMGLYTVSLPFAEMVRFKGNVNNFRYSFMFKSTH